MENKSSVKLSNISISITVPNGNGSVGTNNVGGYLPINSKPKNQLDHKNGNGRENTQVRPMLIPQVQCLISIAQILNSMWK
jgi:hypothetical protein